jgi:hypothetical protein
VNRLFIDFTKAYDSVKGGVLFNILLEFGIPKKLVRLIKMRLNETYSKVRVRELLSDTIASRTALRPTQPPMQWIPGVLSLGVKRPGREADHSPPSSAEVNKAWRYTSTPPYVFMAWCLVKHRNKFIFTLHFLFRMA